MTSARRTLIEMVLDQWMSCFPWVTVQYHGWGVHDSKASKSQGQRINYFAEQSLTLLCDFLVKKWSNLNLKFWGRKL